MTNDVRARAVRGVFTLLALGALAACTTGQANTTPPITTGGGGGGGGQNAALQLSVGTVNYSGSGVIGLNVLETFRGANGYTAIPITSATLSGPPGFAGPSGSKDPGAGMQGTIPIGSASNQFVIGGAGTTSLLAGADGWGIGPPSCSCGGVNFYPFQPQFADVRLPFTFPGGEEPFYGGPPAYPPTILAPSSLSALVDIPSGWAEGFYLIAPAKTPPAGTYTLSVSYQQNGVTSTKSVGATLPSRKHLPSLLGEPTLHSDHRGGLYVSVHFPPGVTEMIANVIDANVPPAPPPSGGTACPTGLGFATLVFKHGGTQHVPDNLGNYGQGGAPTFCKNDVLSVQLLGFDYDDVELGPPNNAQQRPPLPKRADVTYTSTTTFE